MDAVENDSRAGAPNGKRRRLQGACDTCRKKKIRCDSAEMPNNRCTNCITVGGECTHSRSKGIELEGSSFPPQKIVKKTAQEHVAEILSATTFYVPSNDPIVTYKILLEVAQYARTLEERLAALQPQTLVPITSTPAATSPGSPPLSMSTEGPTNVCAGGTLPGVFDEHLPIRDPLRGLTPSGNETDRFYGRSSSVEFIKAAMKLMHGNTARVVGVQRPEFWTTQVWEKLSLELPLQVFPDADLLAALVKIYFEQINTVLGILHYPSFRKSLADGQHYRDRDFGAVVLGVCALASRYSDDPRVFLEGADSEHSGGWKWFRQVRPLRVSFSPEPSLAQLQLLILSVSYLAGTSTPEECWILAGLGVRFAQAAGAHHRSGYTHMTPLTGELYKRAFWILCVADTLMSSFKGRPSITSPASFDLDLPLGCDDEYWEMPNAVQPRGKPSISAYVPIYLQLMMIFGRIQGAVYPVDGQPCSEEVIVELDSALNDWVDKIPDHLKWDPLQENQIFLDQSAALYATYYHAQILIHRPFIPAPGKESMFKTAFPSLAICANASRSCGHVLDVQARRGRGLLHLASVMTALFDSAVVLLINVWAVVGGTTPEDFDRATADAQNCVRVLQLYERRWRVAGRKCDIISAMLNIGRYTADARTLKRPREVDAPPILPTMADITLESPALSARSVTQQMHALERSMEETDHLFSLPLHTEELGRLPIYDSFDYQFTFQSDDILYQPHSHLSSAAAHDAGDALLAPELLLGDDPTTSSVFSPQLHQYGFGTDGDQDPQLSFDIPSGLSWEDWSAYLASVDGLTHGHPQYTSS
ncbi:fungal-specific transcription factor domain-containing protein [Mycena filopes]|nr:fungal-specific transcription factor domain-containing protein [Mycena filopes]